MPFSAATRLRQDGPKHQAALATNIRWLSIGPCEVLARISQIVADNESPRRKQRSILVD